MELDEAGGEPPAEDAEAPESNAEPVQEPRGELGIEDQMEQIEDVVIEVCDQLDEAVEPAEVQIVTDEAAGEDAREAGTFDDINKTLI